MLLRPPLMKLPEAEIARLKQALDQAGITREGGPRAAPPVRERRSVSLRAGADEVAQLRRLRVGEGSSDKKEVLQLVSVLAAKVASCSEKLSAQNVGNAMYGLQKMSSDKKEVLQLVSVLATKVASCSEKLDAQA
eukprot:gene49363-67040_t